MNPNRIRVKFLSRISPKVWPRQFPNNQTRWGICDFTFDSTENQYDWLVVYDELPRKVDKVEHPGTETLACSAKNTLLVTLEPTNIKHYSSAYTKQFGWVLTSQAEWALPHPGHIYSQPALRWYYGLDKLEEYNDMAVDLSLHKKQSISTVCSAKQQKHTLHQTRFNFVHELKELLPEIELFGRGIRPIDDKSEALNDFKYHIAIENFQGLHHWTEKLSDPFLANCLPFYAGCPNAADYFPAESFISIDINDAKSAAKIIQEAINNNEYEKRIPQIAEAKRRVLEEYNLFSVLSREIESRNTSEDASNKPIQLKARRDLRKNPIHALQDLLGKRRQMLAVSRNK